MKTSAPEYCACSIWCSRGRSCQTSRHTSGASSSSISARTDSPPVTYVRRMYRRVVFMARHLNYKSPPGKARSRSESNRLGRTQGQVTRIQSKSEPAELLSFISEYYRYAPESLQACAV